jgi:hypothetical protein
MRSAFFYIYPDGIERLRIHKESGVVQKETILLGHLSGFPVKSIDFDANYGFVYLTKKGRFSDFLLMVRALLFMMGSGTLW